MNKKEKFVIIDGHHLIFRAYYAMSNMKKGAIFGFASILLNIIEKENPDYFVITFDLFKSFRHDKYENYKAQRKITPDDLKEQMPKIYEMVEKMGIPVFAVDGYEADDLIGSLAIKNLEFENLETIIVTGDMDILQLVKNGKTTVAIPHKGYKEVIYFDEEKVFEKYGLTPKQIICLKAIAGDTSDNIKGIEGIGDIGATKLIKKFGSAKKIFEEFEKLEKNPDLKCDFIKGAIRKKLLNGKEKIDDLIDMTTIRTDVPLDNFSLENVKFSGIKSEGEKFLRNEEFFSLVRKLEKIESDKRLEEQLMLF
ncbi:hypothetical protein LR002_00815 [Candidatus Gracilibacteria bacterium]|nr:hypothetical protein [Candidatus Gracilibacteria bacterium]